jgi:hypothetical protein
MQLCYETVMPNEPLVRASKALVTFLVGSALWACSSTASAPPADSDAGDASVPVPTATAPADAAPSVSCATTVSEAKLDEAIVSPATATRPTMWVFRARQGETFMTLTLTEGYPESGAFGEEQLVPAETNVALLVQTECRAHGDHYHCGPSFVPTAGAWKVVTLGKEVGAPFELQLTADAARASITKGKATLDPSGETVCLRGVTLSGKLVAP